MDVDSFLGRFEQRLVNEITREDDDDFHSLGTVDTKALKKSAQRSKLREAFPHEDSIRSFLEVVKAFSTSYDLKKPINPEDKNFFKKVIKGTPKLPHHEMVRSSSDGKGSRNYILGDPLNKQLTGRSHIVSRIQSEEPTRRLLMKSLEKAGQEKISLAIWLHTLSEIKLFKLGDVFSKLDAERAYWDFYRLRDAPPSLQILEEHLGRRTRYELPRSKNLCEEERSVGYLAGFLKPRTTPKSVVICDDSEEPKYRFTLEKNAMLSVRLVRQSSFGDSVSRTIVELPLPGAQVDWTSLKDKSNS